MSKSIARWVAVNRPRGASPLRRATFYGSWTAIGLAAAYLAWSTALGDRTIYRAGPLAGVHQSFGHQCSECHQDHWRGLARLATLNNSHTSTPNTACESCHLSSAHNDHALAATHQCAHCHREHRGNEMLVRVDEQLCVQCHADLKTSETPPRNFAQAVPDFQRHPEFAVFRHADEMNPGAGHLIHEIAARESDEVGSRWVDKSQLRFNHKVHMNPDGVLVAEQEVTGSARRREKLTCQSCHQPDTERSYMRPIVYQEHCRRCHPLVFAADDVLDEPLPHREPELVRGVIRQRLSLAFSKMAAADDARVDESGRQPPDELLSKPGLPRPLPIQKGELEWVNQMLARVEHAVFGKEAQGGCRYCHTLTDNAETWHIVPPDLPDRWLPHSRFDHERHQTMKCADCHAAATSTDTADILLPKVEVCQSCHQATDGQGGGGGARTDCVECHDYHGRQSTFTNPHTSTTSSSGQ